MKMEHRENGILLPHGFQPSPHTVIIGRGKEPKQNLGNKRLSVLASSFLQKYQKGDKRCKSQIVSDIIFMIRQACKEVSSSQGGGAFVKHAKDGRWYEMDHGVAREKIGALFRDLLADQYKSSAKSKVARRQQPRILRERRISRSSFSLKSTASSFFASDTILSSSSCDNDFQPNHSCYTAAVLDILQQPVASLDAQDLDDLVLQ